nr:immunoglobulin light chain junction region [Macaca mulatta]
YMQGIQFPLTF